MVLLRNFLNIFNIPELRKKVLFTLGVLIIYRLGAQIPVIGVDVGALQALIAQGGTLGGILNYLDLISGGVLTQCTVFALGIGPYISASIMMQILGMSVPYLEQLLKEGEYGRKIINQYTRYLTIVLSIAQSFALIGFLHAKNLIITPGISFTLLFILSLSVGAIFVMWLGEQISLFGLGNGSSMIIFAGIVARFPTYLGQTIYAVRQGNLDTIIAILILLIFVGITACIVFLEKGQRKIPVQYARRVVGNRVYGGQSTYIPFKINNASVMPVIFASMVLNMPLFIASMLAAKFPIFKVFAESLTTGVLGQVVLFVLIIAFSFFYTALLFNPEELADNIKKSGGFIPGIRPGRKTAEFFNYILTRVGLVGAFYLAFLAITPSVLRWIIYIPFMLSGTALLIAVGVALESATQIESYLIEHKYEGFLTSGRLRGRGAR